MPMSTVYNHHHALHHGKVEMFRGELVPCFEIPDRADFVLQELKRRQLGAVRAPDGLQQRRDHAGACPALCGLPHRRLGGVGGARSVERRA